MQQLLGLGDIALSVIISAIFDAPPNAVASIIAVTSRLV